MAAIALSFLLSGTGYNCQQAAAYATREYPSHFPDTYMDSASPLVLLPALTPSQAVTAGQKFFANGTWYWECTVSGTIGTTVPYNTTRLWISYPSAQWTVPTRNVNAPEVYGTATLRMRKFGGWDRAINVWAATFDPYYDATYTGYHNSTYTIYIANTCAIVADYAVFLDRHSAVISCTKVFPPTTFAAGAKALRGTVQASWSYSGFRAKLVKGVTMGDETTIAPLTGGYANCHEWDTNTFYDRCTLQSMKGYTEANGIGAHLVNGDNLLCTFKNIYTGAACAVFGSAVDSDINFATVTRAGTASQLYFEDGYTSYARVQATGCDFTALSGALVSTETGFASYGSAIASGGVPAGYVLSAVASTLAGASFGGYTDLLYGAYVPFAQSTVHYRSGGAADGFSSYSMFNKLYADMHTPIRLVFDNTKTDESFEATVEFEWSNPGGSGITALTEADVWLEAVYPAEADTWAGGFSCSYDTHRRPGLFTTETPANLPTSSATWVGGLTGAVKQSVKVRLHPRRAGPIYITVRVWLSPYTRNLFTGTSLDIYVCPKITFSNVVD